MLCRAANCFTANPTCCVSSRGTGRCCWRQAPVNNASVAAVRTTRASVLDRFFMTFPHPIAAGQTEQ